MSLHPFGGRLSRHFGDNLAPQDAYLSYYDIRLTKHDVDCIKHDWLTDNAIAFWEEFLEQAYLKNFPNANIVLLRPSMSFMLMQTAKPETLKDALPNFAQSSHIFLPINNAKDVETPESGSHWSLLVVSILDGVAFHYDSLGGDNDRDALTAMNKLSQLLGKPLRFTQIEEAPQQENGKDCGIFVCSFMHELLVNRLLKAVAAEKISMSLDQRDINSRKGRKRMIEVIENFRREGEKRRSRSPSPYRAKTPPRIDDENARFS